MSFRYIGSKARLAEMIGRHIESWSGRGRFIDAFCGTGVVAEVAAAAGWPINLNDHLACATTMASARLITVSQARFAPLGGYHAALRKLNSQKPVEGFIWREYSPASASRLGIERRYFNEENAGRIDAIRARIAQWRLTNVISETEKRLLIADLLGAVNRVANIAGTFGCFLAKWTPQSADSLDLRPRALRRTVIPVEISNYNVSDLIVEADDLVYLDPPYTKRQYASYYHILETITLGDEPVVEGVAGLRPWRERASEFCYKVRALGALESLIRGLPARRILLSYSEQGHVPIFALRRALCEIGRVSVCVAKRVGRYRPNKVASLASSSVKEHLFTIDRDFVKRSRKLSA